MELTREQAIKEHRKMWNWLAEHPDKDKFDYLDKYEKVERIRGGCFLCEYCFQNDGDFCDKGCILDWGDTEGCMGSMTNVGLYYTYNQLQNILLSISKNSEWSKDIIKGLRFIISRVARTIAKLPERKENGINENR